MTLMWGLYAQGTGKHCRRWALLKLMSLPGEQRIISWSGAYSQILMWTVQRKLLFCCSKKCVSMQQGQSDVRSWAGILHLSMKTLTWNKIKADIKNMFVSADMARCPYNVETAINWLYLFCFYSSKFYKRKLLPYLPPFCGHSGFVWLHFLNYPRWSDYRSVGVPVLIHDKIRY